VSSNPKIVVENWDEAYSPVLPDARVYRQFWAPSVLGIFGTLLLHTLVVQSVIVGYWEHKPHIPDLQTPGLALIKSDTRPAENLVLINLVSSNIDKDSDGSPVLARMTIKLTSVPALRPDPPPLLDLGTLATIEEQESAVPADNGVGDERARLVGIYSNQMKARVERIWRRPRTPVVEGSDESKPANAVEYFQCQVQIVQDSRGYVQEVLLPDCNGSVAWQRSLVMAIQQASPLPAPPSPTVFNRTVALDFVAYPYASGAPNDDYEPEPIKTTPPAVARQR
jgi:hypothetical protein